MDATRRSSRPGVVPVSMAVLTLLVAAYGLWTVATDLALVVGWYAVAALSLLVVAGIGTVVRMNRHGPSKAVTTSRR